MSAAPEEGPLVPIAQASFVVGDRELWLIESWERLDTSGCSGALPNYSYHPYRMQGTFAEAVTLVSTLPKGSPVRISRLQ